MKRRNVAVYGSLRLNEYNYLAFLSRYPDMKHLGTHEVDGFELYSLGTYPATTVGEGKLTVDTFSVSEECFLSMRRMELGAGYYETSLKIDGREYKIWLMEKNRWLNEESKVKTGNWSEFLRQREKGTTETNSEYNEIGA